ncbi:DNA polymerase III subunit alpha [Paucilactobacillus nenjiangensis]|uniref:DNA polymerase III subunit alpha n=1 Tax=Paucilactobacillus nenjiangensis TaxID=1296540 RepID=A0A5P1X1S8_9LACO|nr:DNA polymerase III subunit alpha [Paucilactobacillus nenjiangensis]QER67463.1 DNA polymerase III subunit alpha [Paucilactobacillus nenjiangensis]
MSFVPLQVLSSYSLLKSTSQIKQLVASAKDRGYTALAITDENVLYGAFDFYNEAVKQGIKPLIGMTIVFPSEVVADDDQRLVLIAKNYDGYRHLMKITTTIQTLERGETITLDQLSEWFHDLFVILPTDNDLYRLIQSGQADEARVYFEQLAKSVDEQSLLIGINPSVDAILRQTMMQLVTQLNTQLIGLSRVGYLNADDHFSVEVLRSIDRGNQMNQPQMLASQQGEHYLKPVADIEREFQTVGLVDAVNLTQVIAGQANVKLESQDTILPKFENDKQLDSFTYLKQLCIEGLKLRAIAPGFTVDDYRNRLASELKIIHEMGFDDYFLIVGDVIAYAHQHDIITGPGRGSAAGSLVAYSLAITDVDPLQYNLLFERFLNPERVQMPDIDLDIPDDRREEILQYVHDKYGHGRVAQIITFGTLATKQVLRDVGRVFGLSQFEAAEWSKTIPQALHISLEDSYRQSLPLRNLVADNAKNQLIFETAKKLEGLPRHYSTHAAGIVLSQEKLEDLVPLQDGGDGMLMTQFAKDTVEAIGLLKIDFLGLRNLSILDHAVKLVQQTNPEFALTQIELNDKKTLELFQNGDTNGVFQFESSGIKNVLTQLHPETFELIVAVNALYRPGPMENIDTFIKRKKGQEPVSYPDESLKDIVGVTYGILVYQEQVMQVASKMASFSYGEADLLRRAMSKKKQSVMDSMRSKFIHGAQDNGYTPEVAERIFDYIDQFANYGFNRSHAVAYSKLAFELAYIKAWYPAAFLISLLNTVNNDAAKIRMYMSEAQKHKVKVDGPNINVSEREFTMQDGHILFGLGDVKGLRRDMIRDVLESRVNDGPFTSLLNFVQRLDSKWQKKELIEPLVYVGAFDGLGNNRAELAEALPKIIDSVELTGSSLSLFEELQPTISERKEFGLEQRLGFEEQYLGAYLSGHPVSQFADAGMRLGVTPVAELANRASVKIFVFVTNVKVIRTKRGEQMAFVSGSDQTGSIEVTVFPNLYKRISALLEKNKILLVDGKVETERRLQVIANQIQDAKTVVVKSNQTKPPTVSKRWVLRIDAQHENQQTQQNLADFLVSEPGNIPVIIFEQRTDKKLIQPKERWIPDSVGIQSRLVEILGTDNVVLQNIKK